MKKPISTKVRVLFGVLAVVLLVIACLMGFDAAEALGARPDEAPYFDPYDGTEQRQVLGFNLLSDSFATFTLGENHGCYFAIDNNDYGIFPYIVCMSNQQFENCQDIYDFTFSDESWDASPGYTALYGYPMKIDKDLRDMAIEYFNYFYDEDVLNTENFSDYVGDYYLDATYQPKGANDGVILTVLTVIFGAAALLLFFFAFRRNPETPENAAPYTGQVLSSDGSGVTIPLFDSPLNASYSVGGGPVSTYASPSDISAADDFTKDFSCMIDKVVRDQSFTALSAGEVAAPINHGLGLLGAIGGAAIGGILWVVLYRAGYIAGLAGYLAAFLAMKFYEKLAGGLGRTGVILSTLTAVAVIVLSNCVALSWVIADALSEGHPGRATIGYVLKNFGSMMDTLDLWPDFVFDLVIGLFLGIFASIGPVGAALRAEKAKKALHDQL
jgi:hypothetical protein